MQKALPIGKAGHKFGWRRRNIGSVTECASRAAIPVLAVPKLSRRSNAHLVHRALVVLATRAIHAMNSAEFEKAKQRHTIKP